MRVVARVVALAMVLVASGVLQLPAVRAADGISTYDKHANSAFGHLMDWYWDAGARLFYWRSDHKAHDNGNTRAIMWWSAELWESVLDDYARTGSAWDRQLIDDIYDGWVAYHNGFGSDYNDDRGWWALGATRAFELTGETRFLDTARLIANDQWLYWDSTFGGGIWWKRSTHDQKNVATNAPAAITNARLYEITGRDKYRRRAIALFNWVDASLRSGGRLDDRIELPNNRIQADYSYNYGTYIGAALELNQITGSSTYLKKATSLADSAMIRLASSAGILRDEGTGDGGGFKGIFARNFLAIGTWPALTNTQKAPYVAFLANNSSVAWSHRIDARLWGSSWKKYASLPVESLTDMSAVELFEAVALTH